MMIDETKLAHIQELYALPLFELVIRAQAVLREHHDPGKIQFCTLSSIKTGACPEDCAYCPQSARHKTKLEVHPLLSTKEILEQARQAKANGSTRFCMGAAWRELPGGEETEQIKQIISEVAALGLETCCTLGMLSATQAQELAEAGLHTYNHNIDSSPEFYGQIISTRTFQERLDTLQNVAAAGIRVCSGGIIGMGESLQDRLRFLAVLASLEPQPDSVPINALLPIPGTPLADREPVDPLEIARLVAVARISIPGAMVRLSAGRTNMTREAQALCFLAGANSIHTGEKMLTTPNVGLSADQQLMEDLGYEVLREARLSPQ